MLLPITNTDTFYSSIFKYLICMSGDRLHNRASANFINKWKSEKDNCNVRSKKLFAMLTASVPLPTQHEDKYNFKFYERKFKSIYISQLPFASISLSHVGVTISNPFTCFLM